jgi:KUP system potassium uptake protein
MAMAQEDGLGDGPVPPGRGQGRLWDMDQRIDQPLGHEADRVKSMSALNKVRLDASSCLRFRS